MRPTSAVELIRDAERVLCVGIGGGGDVVGALAIAELARALGTPARLGGTTWERRVIDPLPGPRRLDEVTGAEPLAPAVALAGPDTTGPGGFHFAEARMAAHLGEPVVLVDPNPGPAAIASGLDAAAAHLGADLIILLDVGGDALAHGDEAGLTSPLCDSVLLAAGTRLRTPAIGAVFGAGCDAELTVDEVLARLAEVTAAGGGRGALGLDPAGAERVAQAALAVPTEASAQAAACALGASGPASIRGGRRTVDRNPLGGIAFFFDPAVALASAARLAAAVRDAADLAAAEDALHALGVQTEFDLERAAYAGGAG